MSVPYFATFSFLCFLSFSPFKKSPIKLHATSHSIYSSLPVSPSLPLLSSHLFKDFATCIIRIFNLPRLLCWIFYRHSRDYWLWKSFRMISKWHFTYILASQSSEKLYIFILLKQQAFLLTSGLFHSFINFLRDRKNPREDEQIL